MWLRYRERASWLQEGARNAFLILVLLCLAESALAQPNGLISAGEEIYSSADGASLAEACDPVAAEGPAAIAGSFGGSSKFYKPNQSKVFFHAEKWWIAAPDLATKDWFLWKKSGDTWTKTIRISTVGSVVPDCHLDSPNNKLYILLAHTSADSPHFLRMTYNKSTDTWSMDAGFPVALLGFTHRGDNPSVLVRAKNGNFWIFTTRAGKLFARRSKNRGAKWTGDILLKNLGTHTAMCDAVSFSSGGVDYVGVGYGEDTDPISRYGFLKHKDSDGNKIWSDETNMIEPPPNTFADDHVSMMVSPDNTVYMVVKTNPDAQSATGIALYKRMPNGNWSTHTVFISSEETRPALAIDETNNELYVFTMRLGSPRYGRYRKCDLGKEESLATATTIDYFKVATDDFHNVSTPPHYVNSCSGLLVAAENDTKANIWYQLFALKSNAPSIPPVTLGDITVSPTTGAQNASYEIPITLGAGRGLTGGSGMITITWPDDTELPAAIINAAVTVNGVNAANVSVAPASRRANVKVRNDLPGGTLVSLLFKSTAGLKNPGTPGNYTLEARTSAQTTDATSPVYNIAGVPVPPTGALLAEQTKAVFDKSSQSKVFYFDNKWWSIAQDAIDNQWYLWSYNDVSWTRNNLVDERPAARPDMIVDATNKRLFVLGSHAVNAILFRLAYQGGAWSLEKDVKLTGFNHGASGNVITMTRAKNNALWVFRINNGVLETRVSHDEGDTWSDTIPLKTGLSGANGQTEAVAFTANGNYAGVFYGLTGANNGQLFGFMKHLDTEADNSWTDETGSITRFGAETPEGSLCASVTNNGVVYVMTRTHPHDTNDPNNTLYKRNAAGTWSKFIINIGYDWSSPALAIDATNNRLIVMGIRADATPKVGEYVTVAFGQENTIIDAFATVFMKNGNNNFNHLSAPSKPVTSNPGLLMVGGNTTTDDLWFSKIALDLSKTSEPETAITPQQAESALDEFSGVRVYPNPFNPSTMIRFAVKEPGHVKLQIFNLRGELVRTLANGELSRGLHEKLWNGHDNTGKPVASGVYFYRLQIGEKLYRGRMQLVK